MRWIPIDKNLPDGRDPKHAGVLLLKGTLDRSTLTAEESCWFPDATVRTVGYWDSLDGAWSLTTTPWFGPFFLPTHYAVFPDSLELH